MMLARNDPDGLRSLLPTVGDPDDGAAGQWPGTVRFNADRAGGGAPIAANPLLGEAYAKDRAATLALLRATNEELDRARRREPMEQRTGGLRWSSGNSW